MRPVRSLGFVKGEKEESRIRRPPGISLYMEVSQLPFVTTSKWRIEYNLAFQR